MFGDALYFLHRHVRLVLLGGPTLLIVLIVTLAFAGFQKHPTDVAHHSADTVDLASAFGTGCPVGAGPELARASIERVKPMLDATPASADATCGDLIDH